MKSSNGGQHVVDAKTEIKMFTFSNCCIDSMQLQQEDCFFLFFCNVVLGLEPRASYILSTCSTTEQHPQSQQFSGDFVLELRCVDAKSYLEE